jgi:hypothetical protein
MRCSKSWDHRRAPSRTRDPPKFLLCHGSAAATVSVVVLARSRLVPGSSIGAVRAPHTQGRQNRHYRAASGGYVGYREATRLCESAARDFGDIVREAINELASECRKGTCRGSWRRSREGSRCRSRQGSSIRSRRARFIGPARRCRPFLRRDARVVLVARPCFRARFGAPLRR